MSEADLAVRASYALHLIPPTIEHDTRVKVGMGAKDGGVDFGDFDEWQQGNPRYDPLEVRAMWRSFKPGAVGVATLFHIAKDYGYQGKGDKPTPRPAPATRKPPEPPRKPAPGQSPAEVWERCQPAIAAHPYIQAKRAAGVPLDTLRVLPADDRLRIAGENMAGALVVPCWDGDRLATLQFIATGDTAARLKATGKTSKLNLPGASVKGWFTVGEMVPGGVVHIVEGIGQAWACWQATGCAAVVAFGAGNMGKVAAALRKRDASARLVLVPDVGKEGDAARIAAEHGCAVAAMPQGEEPNFDANDLAQRDGYDVLAALLEGASEPPKPKPLLKPVSVCDVLTNPSAPPAFVWDGYLPRGVVALFGAHGGTGKSTIALMLAVATVTGRPLFGVPTEQSPAVFVSLEDGANIVRHRLAGICRAWGIDPVTLRERLHIVDGTENPELFAADNRSAGDVTSAYLELVRLVESTGAGLVVVDNASDSFGGDEINRRQVRGFMRSLGLVARLTDCAVCLLAHVDKNTSRNRKAEGGEGYSGSTAWHNSARSRLFMTRADDGLLTLEHQKSNLGKRCEPIALVWPESGLPMLASDAPDYSALDGRMQGRADDSAAASLLVLLAEFEGREQFASPAPQARNNVHALLRVEPAFQRLKLNRDATARVVNQCQRAGWIESLDYRSPDRKQRQRWTVTVAGCEFAGLPAPTAPTAPTSDDGAESAHSSMGGAPTAPTYAGGVGDRARTYEGAEQGAEVGHE